MKLVWKTGVVLKMKLYIYFYCTLLLSKNDYNGWVQSSSVCEAVSGPRLWQFQHSSYTFNLCTTSPRSQSRKEMWLTGEKYDWMATWSRLGTAKWLTATCREYDWRRRLCINFVVFYCLSYAVHDIVSGRTAPITCSEYSFSWSCLNLCIICKQFTNVNCN